MARRPIARNPGVASGSERFSVDAAALVTIGPEHDVWRGGHLKVKTAGAIIRIQPPAEANPQFITILVEQFFKDAAAVKVLPPEARERVLLDAAEVSAEAALNTRQVVYGMVATARTGNRDLLVDVMEEALVAAGL